MLSVDNPAALGVAVDLMQTIDQLRGHGVLYCALL
jgi:hypothetical protein